MQKFFSFFLIVILLSSVLVSALIQLNPSNTNQAFGQSTNNEIRDISNYAIYGLHHVELGMNVTINSGSVGVEGASSNMQLPSNAEIRIKDNSNFLDPESAVVGDTIIIKLGTIVQNIFFNELQNEGTVVGTQNTPLTLPVVTNLPTVPISSPGTLAVSVPKDSSLTLQAGQYSDIFVDIGGTLILTGGTYQVTSIDAKKDSKIIVNEPSEIIVQNEIKWAKGVFVGPSEGSAIDAFDIRIFVGGNADINEQTTTDFGKDAVIHANIFAPNGTIKIAKGTLGTGSFIANTVIVDKDSIITLNSSFGVDFETVTKANQVQNEYVDYLTSQDVLDEAVVVDVSIQDVNELKNQVTLLVTDVTIKQNLLAILDTSLSQLTDAGNLVLALDETGANAAISSAQSTLSDFMTGVEAERGIGLTDTVADTLVNSASEIITNSQKRDADVIILEVDEASSTVLVPLLQQSHNNLDQIATLLANLDAKENVSVVAVVESGSAKKGIIKLLGQTGFLKPLVQIAGLKKCGDLIAESIEVVANIKGEPLTFNEVKDLRFANDIFCGEVTEKAFISGNLEFENEVTNFVFAMLDSFFVNQLDPSLQDVKRNVATQLNQPNTKDFWLFEYRNVIKLPTIMDPQTQIKFFNLFEKANDIISGKISGIVFEDVDDDKVFIELNGDKRIPNAGVIIRDIQGVIIDSMPTDSEGEYVFSDLATDLYTISLNPIEGFEQTFPNPLTGGIHVVSIIAGSVFDFRDFGNVILEPPAPQTIFFDDFIETAGWSQTSCILNHPPGQTCKIGLTPALLPVPSLPNWGFVETFDFVPGCQQLGPNVEARFSHPFTVTTSGTYTLSSWVGTSPCTTCDIFSQLLVDGDAKISVKGRNLLFDPPQNRTTFQQATFDMTQGERQITMRSFTPGGMCFGNFRTFFDDITIVESTSPLTGPMTGGPYFYPEINQTSVNATKPTTVTVPLKVEWFEGYYAEPVEIHVIGNLTDIGISSTVTSVMNSTHYKLFDIVFDIPDTATIGEHFINIFVKETDSGDREIETIQLNVE